MIGRPRGDRAARRLSFSALLLFGFCAACLLAGALQRLPADRVPLEVLQPVPGFSRIGPSAVCLPALRRTEESARPPHDRPPASGRPSCIPPADWSLALKARPSSAPPPPGFEPPPPPPPPPAFGGSRWILPLSGGRRAASVLFELVVPLSEAAASGLDGPRLESWLSPSPDRSWLWIPMLERTAAARASRGFADWQPASPASRCHYARRWLAAKLLYGLTAAPRERAALAAALAYDCPPVRASG